MIRSILLVVAMEYTSRYSNRKRQMATLVEGPGGKLAYKMVSPASLFVTKGMGYKLPGGKRFGQGGPGYADLRQTARPGWAKRGGSMRGKRLVSETVRNRAGRMVKLTGRRARLQRAYKGIPAGRMGSVAPSQGAKAAGLRATPVESVATLQLLAAQAASALTETERRRADAIARTAAVASGRAAAISPVVFSTPAKQLFSASGAASMPPLRTGNPRQTALVGPVEAAIPRRINVSPARALLDFVDSGAASGDPGMMALSEYAHGSTPTRPAGAPSTKVMSPFKRIVDKAKQLAGRSSVSPSHVEKKRRAWDASHPQDETFALGKGKNVKPGRK